MSYRMNQFRIFSPPALHVKYFLNFTIELGWGHAGYKDSGDDFCRTTLGRAVRFTENALGTCIFRKVLFHRTPRPCDRTHCSRFRPCSKCFFHVCYSSGEIDFLIGLAFCVPCNSLPETIFCEFRAIEDGVRHTVLDVLGNLGNQPLHSQHAPHRPTFFRHRFFIVVVLLMKNLWRPVRRTRVHTRTLSTIRLK